MGLKSVVPVQEAKEWFLLKLQVRGGTRGSGGIMKNIVVAVEYGKLGHRQSETVGTNIPFEGGPEAPEKLKTVLQEVAAAILKKYSVEKKVISPKANPDIPMNFTKEAMSLWLWDEAQKQWRERYSKVFPA